MVRDHLSERLKAAGGELLDVTDKLDMRAQGAMWLHDPRLRDWRFFLVTSLVDTMGRRKLYQLLLEAFDRVDLPEDMTIADVHLGSPTNPLFQLLSQAVRVEEGGQLQMTNCTDNGVLFDSLIYRCVREIPTPDEAQRIHKTFAKRVKNLTRATQPA